MCVCRCECGCVWDALIVRKKKSSERRQKIPRRKILPGFVLLRTKPIIEQEVGRLDYTQTQTVTTQPHINKCISQPVWLLYQQLCFAYLNQIANIERNTTLCVLEMSCLSLSHSLTYTHTHTHTQSNMTQYFCNSLDCDIRSPCVNVCKQSKIKTSAAHTGSCILCMANF